MSKVAIDWDESELRLVVGTSRGNGVVEISDVATFSLHEDDVRTEVATVLRREISDRGLKNAEALVTIGRGKAELRELQLPAVPEDELPDMVCFQAVRTFASAGETATIDYLVTDRSDSGIEMIAAAMGPKELSEIRKICESASLEPKRIALRPLSAASLYLAKANLNDNSNIVLVDLLADDAEIAVARGGHVIFVRSVRLPAVEPARSRALTGELKRSLFACGDGAKPDKVILWGKASVHAGDRQVLADACGADVQVVDPFDLIEVNQAIAGKLPEHVGRLAPLIGLLAADEIYPDRLIDFLNPRKRPEVKPNHVRTGLLIAVPIAVALVVGYSVIQKFRSLDNRIAELKAANNQMMPAVDLAKKSVQRTETIDQFLDGNVQWLDEIKRLADRAPGAGEMIVRSISACADGRSGGGKLVVSGNATSPDAIDDFENSLRDSNHAVVGDGASEEKTDDAYGWGFSESIRVSSDHVRNLRYERILALLKEQSQADSSAVPETNLETSP